VFDPYHKWLGIPKHKQPPTPYALLGLQPGEQDPEVIEDAARRQTVHLRTYQVGPHAANCHQLLTEVAQARATLLDPEKRKAYEEPSEATEVISARAARASATLNPSPPRAAISKRVTTMVSVAIGASAAYGSAARAKWSSCSRSLPGSSPW
jgi:hypothetical protein